MGHGNDILNMWETRNIRYESCSSEVYVLKYCEMHLMEKEMLNDNIYFITAKRQFYSSSLIKIPEQYWSSPVQSRGC